MIAALCCQSGIGLRRAYRLLDGRRSGGGGGLLPVCKTNRMTRLTISAAVKEARVFSSMNFESGVQMKISLFLLMLFLFCDTCFAGTNKEIHGIIIKEVVYETEEGYVSTDKGLFQIPNPSNEIELEAKDFSLLVENLERLKDAQSTLYLYDDIVIGVSSSGSFEINFRPQYKKKEKIIYDSSRGEKILTNLLNWETDSYRLSIITSDGIFCVSNDFEFKDYREKIYKKLKEYCKEDTDVNIPVLIKYEKEDSYECPGAAMDIEFPAPLPRAGEGVR
jgi:hypothetical protein